MTFLSNADDYTIDTSSFTIDPKDDKTVFVVETNSLILGDLDTITLTFSENIVRNITNVDDFLYRRISLSGYAGEFRSFIVDDVRKTDSSFELRIRYDN